MDYRNDFAYFCIVMNTKRWNDMAGIYLHIPFCKTRCIYCDFYSTTLMSKKERYIRALCQELAERAGYLKGEPVETVYFGGGTPSQLDEDDFRQVFDTLQANYDLGRCTEITVEANPDDLTAEYAEMLQRLPFNRISMGIQTFHDDTLRRLRRRHNAAQAVEAVANCRKAGFDNISIDLIYGMPNETTERWAYDLQQATTLNVEHISAYHLIYEENTPLYNMLHQGEIEEVNEDRSLEFFTMLMDHLKANGYEHYEISNFCKPGRHSRHNSSYWHGIPYLGCGPSAHSFNRTSREWNEASLDNYLQGIEAGQRPFIVEELDVETRYNERILTALRTNQGIDLEGMKQEFGDTYYNYCLKMSEPHLDAGKLEIGDNGRLRLTREGIFISDGIMSDLFVISN